MRVLRILEVCRSAGIDLASALAWLVFLFALVLCVGVPFASAYTPDPPPVSAPAPAVKPKADCPCGCPCDAGGICTCGAVCSCPNCPTRKAKREKITTDSGAVIELRGGTWVYVKEAKTVAPGVATPVNPFHAAGNTTRATTAQPAGTVVTLPTSSAVPALPPAPTGTNAPLTVLVGGTGAAKCTKGG